jgi:hypothetical protein
LNTLCASPRREFVPENDFQRSQPEDADDELNGFGHLDMEMRQSVNGSTRRRRSQFAEERNPKDDW